MRRLRLARLLPLLAWPAIACGFALSNQAFAFFPGPRFVSGVEYLNTTTGHYFLTAYPGEMDLVESGAAGAGWIRTGRGFASFDAFGNCSGCLPVSRFYAPGANSHFFTADAAEAEWLKRPESGWIFEGTAFYVPSMPDAGSGRCEASPHAASTVPVYRLYNNRSMFGDSNHRYTTSAEARESLVAAGWTYEGIAFCVPYVATPAHRVFYFSVEPDPEAIQPAEDCRRGAGPGPSCVGLANLPVPRTLFSSPEFPYPQYTAYSHYTDEFNARTGLDAVTIDDYGWRVLNYTVPSGPFAAVAARDTFVQLTGRPFVVGLHLSTLGRGDSAYSSAMAAYAFEREAPATGVQDARFFPWRNADAVDMDLHLDATVRVATIDLAPGGQAYGHAMIDFIDTRSGRTLEFGAQAWSTLGEGDYVGRSAATGNVIVATAVRPDNPFGRGSRLESDGVYGVRFWIARAEFLRILDEARALDPALSPEPGDYAVANFRQSNEIFGDGAVGLNVSWLMLAIVPR